jgi:hypothetical protein
VHALVAPCEQAPRPLQVPAAVWLPVEQDAGLQTVPAAHSSQAPPLHLPSVLHVDAGIAKQSPRGSSVPFVAAAHTPSVPPVSAAEHAWHAPVHAVSQQSPSAQKPLAHWSVALHAVPLVPFGTHALPEQKEPATHAVSFAHDVRQALEPQT